MIHFFNRQELYRTNSIEKKSLVTQLLSDKNIAYTIQIINRNSPSFIGSVRARTGTFGQKAELMYEYIIYVKKQDYELGKAVVSGSLKQ